MCGEKGIYANDKRYGYEDGVSKIRRETGMSWRQSRITQVGWHSSSLVQHPDLPDAESNLSAGQYCNLSLLITNRLLLNS